tara:strand:- start:3345 stop:4427 length:1083 start_codon:yes stop_codon:yes gene_type:complete
MISTNAKRIIFIGDWDQWTNKWINLDDDSLWDLRWDAFSGWGKKRRDEHREGVDKFSRVIDTSDYVVRCSWLRTQFPGTFTNKHMYGKKVNAIQVNGKNLEARVTNSIRKIKRELKSDYLNAVDLTRTENNYTLQEQFSKPVMSKEESKRYKHESTRLYSQMYCDEIWVSLGYLYRRLDKAISLDNNVLIDNIIGDINLVMSKYSELYTQNISMLSSELFLSLRDEIQKYHLTYDELQGMYGGSLWWSHVARDRGDGYIPFSEIIDGQGESMMINRGLQSIYIGLNDKRFESYDKYIIGHWGIDQAFSHGPTHYNQIAEYRLLTDWVESSVLKYLPEHIDELNQYYVESSDNCFRPLYEC